MCLVYRQSHPSVDAPDATGVDFHGHHLFTLFHLLSTASCKPRILQAASPGLLPPLCTCSTPQSSPPQVGCSTVTGHQPWCKIAAAPVVGKVRTKASEESYCSGQLPETQPDPIFRNSRDAYGRVSKQVYTEITLLMGKMMMKHGILSVPYFGDVCSESM